MALKLTTLTLMPMQTTLNTFATFSQVLHTFVLPVAFHLRAVGPISNLTGTKYLIYVKKCEIVTVIGLVFVKSYIKTMLLMPNIWKVNGSCVRNVAKDQLSEERFSEIYEAAEVDVKE